MVNQAEPHFLLLGKSICCVIGKLLRADNNSFIKCFYLMLNTDADNNISYNKNNWAYQIKTMLQDLGSGDLLINQENCDIFLPEIK